METAFDDIPPQLVMSLDHTFEKEKRSKEITKPPPPEKMAAGSSQSHKYTTGETNATLIVMGANGQVGDIHQSQCYSRARHNTYSFLSCFIDRSNIIAVRRGRLD